MTSKIINMAEKFRDAEDRMLDSLFQSEPIADDGFSNRVLRRVRMRLWIRRLTMPVAILIGGAIALKPATQLFQIGSSLLGAMPDELVSAPALTIPQLPIVLLGGTLLIVGMLTARMLEE